eukprot:7293381-Prymnesium_polylepis.2
MSLFVPRKVTCARTRDTHTALAHGHRSRSGHAVAGRALAIKAVHMAPAWRADDRTARGPDDGVGSMRGRRALGDARRTPTEEANRDQERTTRVWRVARLKVKSEAHPRSRRSRIAKRTADACWTPASPHAGPRLPTPAVRRARAPTAHLSPGDSDTVTDPRPAPGGPGEGVDPTADCAGHAPARTRAAAHGAHGAHGARHRPAPARPHAV